MKFELWTFSSSVFYQSKRIQSRVIIELLNAPQRAVIVTPLSWTDVHTVWDNRKRMNAETIHQTEVREYILSLLPEVSKMLLEFFNSRKFTKHGKGKFDFATTADLETDLFLIGKLKERYPTIPFLTEESPHEDLLGYSKNDLMWVIDPLDGTFNFAKGDTNFACSIALASHTETLVGVCFQPVTKRIYYAQKDAQFAYCLPDGTTRNGYKLTLHPPSHIEEIGINTNWSHSQNGKTQIAAFMSAVIQKIRTIRLQGCAVNDLLAIVDGKTDVYFDVAHMPWDMAAATLIVEKAGVKVTDAKGGPYHLFTPGILAAHPTIHAIMLQLLPPIE